MLSASPVTIPPQGPIVLRANEYAAPGYEGKIGLKRARRSPAE